jgi:hypothetical protein
MSRGVGRINFSPSRADLVSRETSDRRGRDPVSRPDDLPDRSERCDVAREVTMLITFYICEDFISTVVYNIE